MPKNKKTDLIISLVLFVVVLSIYIYTAAPSVYDGDSGDLTVAVNVMGLPYPTGFPLYIILGKIFTTLIPVGSLDFRLNVFSAFCAAAIVALMYFVFKNLGIKRFIAIIGCLTLAFSKTLWSHAGAARVYSLNGLIFVILLLLIIKWFNSRERKYLYLFALLLGVGFGVHISIVFTAAMFLVVLIFTEPKLLINLKFIFRSLILFVIPFIQYAYLFVAYNRFTIMTFGDLSSFNGFVHYITQKDYAYKIGAQSFALVKLILDKTFNLFVNEFTVFVFVLVVLGIVIMGAQKNKRPLFYGLVAVVVANLLLMTNYGNSHDTVILFRYYLLSYIVFSIFIVFALQSISVFVFKHKKLLVSCFVLFSIVPIIPLYANFSANNRHNNNIVLNLAMNVLDSTEENSLIISQGDALSGALWYLQSTGIRKDVIIIDAGLLAADWYVKNQNKLYPDIVNLSILRGDKMGRHLYLAGIAINNRPVYFTFPTTSPSITVYNPINQQEGKLFVVPNGIIYRIFLNQKPDIDFSYEMNEKLWEKYRLDGISYNKNYDYLIVELVREYSIALNNLGIYYYDAGLVNEGLQKFREALEIVPGNITAANNLRGLSE